MTVIPITMLLLGRYIARTSTMPNLCLYPHVIVLNDIPYQQEQGM